MQSTVGLRFRSLDADREVGRDLARRQRQVHAAGRFDDGGRLEQGGRPDDRDGPDGKTDRVPVDRVHGPDGCRGDGCHGRVGDEADRGLRVRRVGRHRQVDPPGAGGIGKAHAVRDQLDRHDVGTDTRRRPGHHVPDDARVGSIGEPDDDIECDLDDDGIGRGQLRVHRPGRILGGPRGDRCRRCRRRGRGRGGWGRRGRRCGRARARSGRDRAAGTRARARAHAGTRGRSCSGSRPRSPFPRPPRFPRPRHRPRHRPRLLPRWPLPRPHLPRWPLRRSPRRPAHSRHRRWRRGSRSRARPTSA